MPNIEKTLSLLSSVEVGRDETRSPYDTRSVVLVTLLYLCLMLSVPVVRLDVLLWFGIYPIVAAPLTGNSFLRIFLKSLWVLPLVALVALFNPIVDRQTVFVVCGVAVSRGWITFVSILVRGLFAMQALLLVISSTGFIGLVRGLRRLGLPAFLTTQLLMVFRYMSVLLEEALTMKRARDARSYGRARLPLSLWGVMVGQLFIRSVERSERIGKAMMARGFNGSLPDFHRYACRWKGRDTLWLATWTLLFILLRFFNLSAILFGQFAA